MSPDRSLSRLQAHFADHFVLEALLGRGGSARVFTVRNLRLDRLEALKVLSESNEEDEDFAERFAVEAKVAASLDHPHIVKVYDYGELQGVFWYTMQLIDGPSLSSEIWNRGIFDELSAAQLSLPLLAALDYSHGRGVVHRDIKPANIIIDREGRPFLMDFGIAKSTDSMLKTRTGLILGTPAYVAPEQAAGQPIDGRADLYSLAVTLYQMVSGALPFTADNPLSSVVMRMTVDPEPLHEKREDVDRRFESIVMRALARDRDERYSSAREMRDCLVEFCGGDEDAVVLPTCPVLGLGKPLPQTGADDDEISPTVAVTSGSEAYELRGLRRHGRVRRWISVATVAALAAVLLYVGFQLLGPRLTGDTVEKAEGVVALPTSIPTVPVEEAEPLAEDSGEEVSESLPTPKPEVIERRETIRVPPATAEPPARRAFTPPMQLDDEETIRVPVALAEVCRGNRISLSVGVAETGLVENARVISSGHPDACAEHALEVVKNSYRFKPAADVEGIPVAAPLTMVFNYDLVVKDVVD